MNITKRKAALYLVIGALLLWAIAYATISASSPKLYSPYSFTVVMPVFLFYELFDGHSIAFVLAPLVIPALFAAWSLPLLNGQERIPKRTKIAAGVLVSLSLVFLALSWKHGVQYQGTFHTIAIYLFNVAFWAVLLVVVRRNSQASYASNFLFHWVLFAWLGWVAFPWLGELI